MNVLGACLALSLAAAAAPVVPPSGRSVLMGDMARREQSLAGQGAPALKGFAAELAALRQRAQAAPAAQLSAVSAAFREWERRLDSYLAGGAAAPHAVVASRPAAGAAPTAKEAAEYNRPKLEPRALLHTPGVVPRFGDVADGSVARSQGGGAAALPAVVPMPRARPSLYRGEARDLKLDAIAVPAALPLLPVPDKPNLADALLRRWGRRTAPTVNALMRKASEHGINHYLIAAITDRESTGRYWVKSNAREAARGAMQVKPSTAREVGVHGDLYDPAVGIEAGIRRFKQMYAKFRDVTLALAHYYSGPNSKNPNIRYAQEVLERAAEIRRASGIWV